MKKIGLTGNIGSGKTYVSKVFEALGVPIYYADLEARKILNLPETIEILKQTFGPTIALKSEEINRAALADIVFNSSTELDKLNRIIHPKLKDHFLIWTHQQTHSKYIIQEAAILFENGFDKFMDLTITVAAPQEIRLKRVMERDGQAIEQVLARMNHQWTDEKKEKTADFIIDNSGNQMILPQVLKLHQIFNQ
jgi:dephospho-CoA kinase